MGRQVAGATAAIMISIVMMTGCGTVPTSHQVSAPSTNNPVANKLDNSQQDTSSKLAASTSSGKPNPQESGQSQESEDGHGQLESATAIAAAAVHLHLEQSANQAASPSASQPAKTSTQGNPEKDPGSGNPVQTPTSQSPGTVSIASVQEIFSVPDGEVALTIDDGPSPYTEQIISVLNQYHVKATFFFIGNQVLQYPDAVRATVASGEEIGDHTVTHPELTHLSAAGQEVEIEQGAKDIAMYDPLPITLFRPPYELMNHDTMTILAKDHMKLALWNRDPRDWDAKNPQQIVQAILQGNPSGGVFDLHDKQITLEALPAILQGLLAMHLKIVLLPS